MSKTGSTKNKILDCLGSGQKTMSEISSALDLAPSTVSQHLQELEYIGAIERVENEHIRKWKYYKVNPNFNRNVNIIEMMNRRIPQKIVYYLIAALAVVAIAYFATTYYGKGAPVTTTYSAPVVNVPLRLTDPPTVPKGTSSLVVTYSSVGVQSINSSGVKTWTYLNTSGSVDLMSLINSSQVIGNVSLSGNSTIKTASLRIVSAQVTINGTTYNVTTPSDQIAASIALSNKVNDSNGVLLDFSPTLVTAYSNGSTIFILLPSIKAAVVPNPASVNFGPGKAKASINVGQRFALQEDERAYLNYSNTNLTLTNAAITAGNGTVGFAVTVKNNGNQSVDIQSVAIIGKEMPYVIVNQSCAVSMMCKYLVNGSAKADAQTEIGINTQVPVPIISSDTGAAAGLVSGLGIGGQGGSGSVSGQASGGSGLSIGTGGSSSTSVVSGVGSSIGGLSVGGSNESGNAGIETLINASGVQTSGGLNGVFVGGPGESFRIVVRHINKTNTEVIGNGQAFNFGIVTADNSTVLGEIGNKTLSINTSAFIKEGLPQGAAVSIAAAGPVLVLTNQYRAVFFAVEANGTLATNGFNIPAFSMGHDPLEMRVENAFSLKTAAGYGLAAQASHTFTYNGTIEQGPPGLWVSLVPGDTYTVVVQADGRIFQQNVTAV